MTLSLNLHWKIVREQMANQIIKTGGFTIIIHAFYSPGSYLVTGTCSKIQHDTYMSANSFLMVYFLRVLWDKLSNLIFFQNENTPVKVAELDRIIHT